MCQLADDSISIANGVLGAVAADILTDDTLTFALVAGTTTAATCKGNDFEPRFRPFVTIEASAVPEPASLALGAATLIRRR